MSTEADQLKLTGLALADAAASQEWKDRWDAAIARLAAEGHVFTAEHVRGLAGDPTDHPNAIGARFNAAARRGLIRKVGWQASERPERHRNPLTVWVGVE